MSYSGKNVALHPEGVDRNRALPELRRRRLVALHPEGVDRNSLEIYLITHPLLVALHPEGVDRNSARRGRQMDDLIVALHPEGVDRNIAITPKGYTVVMSPSTRRAWIEIRRSRPARN